MVKKYYQTEKDRMHESRGMKRYERERRSSEPNTHHRERQGYKEDMDSGYMGMISEDHSAPSNLPQEVVHKYYPPCDYVDNYYLDDTIRGIDDTLNDNVRTIERHQSDSMY